MMNRRNLFAVPAAAAAFSAAVGAKISHAAKSAAEFLDIKIDPAKMSDKERARRDVRMPDLDLESAQDFLTGFRKYIRMEISPKARDRAKAHLAAMGVAEDKQMSSADAYKLMTQDPVYAWSSRLSVSNQQLTWHTLRNHLHRHAEHYISEMEQADKSGPGTLELNPTMHIPEYTTHEIHIQPGGYVGDAFAGHVYHRGTKNFYFEENDYDEIHTALAQNIQLPKDGKITRILDIGCGIGQLTTACKDRFPNAEVWGVDVGGPMVRYGHLRATKMKSEVHFAQRLAEDTKFPDGHFDVVTSYLLFHEVTPDAAKKIFAEAHRVLRPGGVFVPFDLVMPPRDRNTRGGGRPMTVPEAAGSYAGSYLNGEPFIPMYRNADVPGWIANAGFEVNREFAAVREGKPFNFATIVATKTA